MFMSFHFKRYLILRLILASTTVGAANRIGNGGDGVVCGAKNRKSVQLLDFYEAEKPPHVQGDTPKEVLQNVVNRLKENAPHLYNQYQRKAEN
ncbi:MAG: hypothetical protein KDD22_06385, partial [Bdellovibrionales bacterium]|nr:hypothetical protein [Bdellovibrionales bacterium]